MKIKTALITGTGIITILLGFYLWRPTARTEEAVPYPKPASCLEATANQIYLMRMGWQQNLQPMMDQEKPTSEITDDVFESLRTYRCWLDYLCQTVLFSGPQDPTKMATYTGPNARPLTWTEIDKLPSCSFPGNVEIPTTKLMYLPECNVSTKATTVILTQQNFDMCQRLTQEAMDTANIGLERTLRMNSADQSIRPMQEKLTEILIKMQGMENHMGFLKNQIESLDKRLPCYIKKCD